MGSFFAVAIQLKGDLVDLFIGIALIAILGMVYRFTKDKIRR